MNSRRKSITKKVRTPRKLQDESNATIASSQNSQKINSRRNTTALQIRSPPNSQDESNDTIIGSQDSQKLRAKNYSAEESAALIRCSEKYHAIISKNSNRDKDKKEKNQAWEKIKKDFDTYCKSQGIYVSTIEFLHLPFDLRSIHFECFRAKILLLCNTFRKLIICNFSEM